MSTPRHHVRLRLIARARASAQVGALPLPALSAEDEAFIASIAKPTQSDAEIGRLCGCTRENVRQVRSALGLPPSHAAARAAPSLEAILRTPALRELLGKLPDTEIAERAGTSVATVATARAVAQQEAAPRPSLIRPFEHLLGVETDAAVAALAGTSHVAVVRYRRRQGIPSRRAVAKHEAAEKLDGDFQVR